MSINSIAKGSTNGKKDFGGVIGDQIINNLNESENNLHYLMEQIGKVEDMESNMNSVESEIFIHKELKNALMGIMENREDPSVQDTLKNAFCSLLYKGKWEYCSMIKGIMGLGDEFMYSNKIQIALKGYYMNTMEIASKKGYGNRNILAPSRTLPLIKEYSNCPEFLECTERFLTTNFGHEDPGTSLSLLKNNLGVPQDVINSGLVKAFIHNIKDNGGICVRDLLDSFYKHKEMNDQILLNPVLQAEIMNFLSNFLENQNIYPYFRKEGVDFDHFIKVCKKTKLSIAQVMKTIKKGVIMNIQSGNIQKVDLILDRITDSSSTKTDPDVITAAKEKIESLNQEEKIDHNTINYLKKTFNV